MAIRTKTLVYAWPMLTALQTDAAVVTFTQQTITVPETASRVFTSAIIEVGWQDVISATGGLVAEFRVACSVAAAAYTTITELNDINHSAANLAILCNYDFTAQFTSNFGAGTTATVDCQMYVDQSTGTTLGYRNATAVLYLTYNYDDAASTQAKTIFIPIESLQIALGTAALAEIGTNQIPILTGASGFIKENLAPTILDYFFIIDTNESGVASTVDRTLNVGLDSEAATVFGATERALASDRNVRFVWSRNGSVPTTTAVHAFKAFSSATVGFNHMGVVLVVTYSFNATAVLGATNSLIIPFDFKDQGGTAAADQNIVRIKVDVQEPTTIALLQSGVQIHAGVNALAASAFSVIVGSQVARAYTIATSLTCGGISLIQRFDANAAQGSGLTLSSRGQKYIDVKIYCAAQRTFAGIGGLIYLNYSSGVATGGISTHNHTTIHKLADYASTVPVQYREIATIAPVIGDTAYSITNIGILTKYINNPTTTSPTAGLTYWPWTALYEEVLSGEGPYAQGDGWLLSHSFMPPVSPEVGVWFSPMDLTADFARHSSEPDTTLLAIETTRKYRFVGPRVNAMAYFLVTYHSIAATIAGTISGFSGDGSGITVDILDTSNHKILYTTTTAVGGTFSIAGFSYNGKTLYASVRQDANHVGRSDNNAGA